MLLHRNRWVALIALVGLTVPAFGQDDAVELKWKFEKDKAFYQEMSTVTKQTMKVMGMDITQNQSQTFYFSWTPREQNNGNWVLKQKIEGVKMDIEISGNKISYDSTKEPGTGSALAEFFKALVGSEFTLTISPKMEVTKIEGRDEFLKKLIQSNPSMEALLKQILSDEALKQMADPAFAVVPSKAVKKGDSWTKESKLNMGPIGTYDTTYKYTYEGKQDKLDKIKVETTLKYAPPATDAGAVLPFKIKSADLKSKDATGTMLFDNDKGRLDSSETNLKLEGKLTIEIGGMATEVELFQTQKTTVKTTDKNPIEKK